MAKLCPFAKARPAAPPEADALNALDDEAHARCVAYVRAHARGRREGLFGPGSVSWEMYREPATLLAGLSAVLLQMAHPSIAAGVSQHSTFADDLRGRAMRTSGALYRLVFGTLDDALAVTRRLHRVHRRVWGHVTEGDGGEYRANDPELLRWVAATVTVAGEQAFEAFVRPLTEAERERAWDEMLVANAAVGIEPGSFPPDRAAFAVWYRAELESPRLVVGPTARRVVEAISKRPLIYGPFDELLAAGFLPPAWRDAYGLRWDGARQRRFDAVVRALRAAVAATPAPYRYAVAWHQAQARLGRATSQWSRALEALGRRWELPTGLPA